MLWRCATRSLFMKNDSLPEALYDQERHSRTQMRSLRASDSESLTALGKFRGKLFFKSKVLTYWAN